MNKLFTFCAGIAAFCAFTLPAQAGEERISESRPIDAQVVRVKLEGVIDLKLKQGDVAQLIITGDKKLVAKTRTVQDGDTLRIDTDIKSFKFGHNSLRAELTLPRLREVTSESVGWTDVRGFSGDELELALEGAGSMKVICNYKHVSANLGGVGSMNIQGGTYDGIDLNLRGAGLVTLTGRAKWLKATMGGLGGLNAQEFDTDAANIDLSGLGDAKINVKKDANLTLSGMGSVTVYGKPLNRQVSVDGLGKVNWK
jgi:hypothetical protein